MGSHYANFRAITEDLLAHDAVRIAAREELAAVLIELLQDRSAAQAMGSRALQVFSSQAGATNRCVEALKALLAAQAGMEPPA
jgi:3-deoxy-D-manno-octulosonic-acid transferase